MRRFGALFLALFLAFNVSAGEKVTTGFLVKEAVKAGVPMGKAKCMVAGGVYFEKSGLCHVSELNVKWKKG